MLRSLINPKEVESLIFGKKPCTCRDVPFKEQIIK